MVVRNSLLKFIVQSKMKKLDIKDLKVGVCGREFVLNPYVLHDNCLLSWSSEISLDDYFAITGLAHNPIKKAYGSIWLNITPDYSCHITWYEHPTECSMSEFGGRIVIDTECVTIL